MADVLGWITALLLIATPVMMLSVPIGGAALLIFLLFRRRFKSAIALVVATVAIYIVGGWATEKVFGSDMSSLYGMWISIAVWWVVCIAVLRQALGLFYLTDSSVSAND